MDDNKLQSGSASARSRIGDMPRSTPPVNVGESDAIPNEITGRAGELASQGFEQAKRLTASTKERVLRTADEKKGLLSDKLEELVGHMDDLGQKAGGEGELPRRLVDGASRALRNVQRTIDERSTAELFDAVGRQIRQRPGLFLAGCLAVGFIGARLLRK